MSLEDLPQIIELYGTGIMAGALLSGVVWAVGYGIQAFLGFLKSAT